MLIFVVSRFISYIMHKFEISTLQLTRFSFFAQETPKDSGSICNWLHRKTRKSWKRNWFKLKEQVLYVYKASEDMRALETIPVLGYKVETFREVRNSYGVLMIYAHRFCLKSIIFRYFGPYIA